MRVQVDVWEEENNKKTKNTHIFYLFYSLELTKFKSKLHQKQIFR
jgi:hypothetical protein